MIPDSHRDLLEGRHYGVLTTMMPDGQPQSTMVWLHWNGQHVLVTTTAARQKTQNMLAEPRVTVLVVDPRQGDRWIEVRGRAAVSTAGGEALADEMTRKYTGYERFYGGLRPESLRERETRVVVAITPEKVTLDAIFR